MHGHWFTITGQQNLKLAKWKQLKGTGYGFCSPILITTLVLEQKDLKIWPVLFQTLKVKFQRSELQHLHQTVQLIFDLLALFHRQADLPVFEQGKLLNGKNLNEEQYQVELAIPYYNATAALQILSWLSLSLNSISGSTPDGALITEPKAAGLQSDKLLSALKRFSPGGSNTLRFLRAAYQHKIPWRHLIDNTFQFGHAENSHWLDSSFTENTSVLGARLARNKLATADILRQAGLPVPRQFKVRNVKEAVNHVAKLGGFPVVIKPIDRDQGAGVTAGISNIGELEIAFQKAQKASRRIIIEQYIEGMDHRLYVFNGELIWAIKRVPGGVTGDGKHTVLELLQQVNADPQRGMSSNSALKTIELDHEAEQMLQKQKLTSNSVPESDQFVPLRRTSNVSTGGMPVAALNVHPDNKLLAENAAKALKLDIAGVDLLIPDISQSWLNSSSGICEINAQPQFGYTTNPGIYGDILLKLFKQRGRIPTVLVLDDAEHRTATELAEQWPVKDQKVAVASDHGYEIKGQQISQNDSSFTSTQAALGNQEVQAIITSCQSSDICSYGLPFDCIDLVVFADTPSKSPAYVTAYQLILSQMPRYVIASAANQHVMRIAGELSIDERLEQCGGPFVDNACKLITSLMTDLTHDS